MDRFLRRSWSAGGVWAGVRPVRYYDLAMYPGGKGLCYQRIINVMPPHSTYVEAFLGGGAVMREKRAAELNIGIDVNPIVLPVTAQMIQPGSTPVNDDAPAPSGTAVAAATIMAGDGAAPPGTTMGSPIVMAGDGRASSEMAVSSKTPPKTAILAASTAVYGDGRRQPSLDLAMSTTPPEIAMRSPDGRFLFLCMDAIAFLESYPFQGNEFVYCDPPYLLHTRRSQRPLYAHEYDESDHERLLACIRRLSCSVAISGYWSELYAGRLSDWHSITFTSQTRAGKPATEWLWMNYPPPARLHDYRCLGDDYRERERIKRKKQRWVARLGRMDATERRAIQWAIQEAGLEL